MTTGWDRLFWFSAALLGVSLLLYDPSPKRKRQYRRVRRYLNQPIRRRRRRDDDE